MGADEFKLISAIGQDMGVLHERFRNLTHDQRVQLGRSDVLLFDFKRQLNQLNAAVDQAIFQDACEKGRGNGKCSG
jgi:hypothetical protein